MTTRQCLLKICPVSYFLVSALREDVVSLSLTFPAEILALTLTRDTLSGRGETMRHQINHKIQQLLVVQPVLESSLEAGSSPK